MFSDFWPLFSDLRWNTPNVIADSGIRTCVLAKKNKQSAATVFEKIILWADFWRTILKMKKVRFCELKLGHFGYQPVPGGKGAGKLVRHLNSSVHLNSRAHQHNTISAQSSTRQHIKILDAINIKKPGHTVKLTQRSWPSPSMWLRFPVCDTISCNGICAVIENWTKCAIVLPTADLE